MASKDERRGRDSQRQAAVNVVAAYLADQDADVYNIADAAVREDALGLPYISPRLPLVRFGRWRRRRVDLRTRCWSR
jgi:hypothetical protein